MVGLRLTRWVLRQGEAVDGLNPEETDKNNAGMSPISSPSLSRIIL